MSMFVKFNGVKGHSDFQMKINQHGTTDHDFEFSCGCGFRVPSFLKEQCVDLWCWMQGLYEGVEVEKEKSHWKDRDFKRTPHVFCDKDDEHMNRIIEMVFTRRERLNASPEYPAAFKLEEKTMGEDLMLQIWYKTLLTVDQQLFIEVPARNGEEIWTDELKRRVAADGEFIRLGSFSVEPTKKACFPKKEKTSSKKTNAPRKKPLMNDDELIRLFSQPATNQKKNKKTKKNNQRKTKKTAKK
ncbi:Oidioi.mRNA.OKI2018_I69.chr2.g6805.t1.cds [Oikopleura dioica]|uniref:Oidioi.mRNA.OKI2018_I69.chr2.g6805.t1.cds n=1 Tax=Oikopleura dioica TaxID=34765 RepID=A0ABN7TAZ6_OIKDI|nr:Oidioi.mRNA.OKI2018_I69.chr2.g6805.t1.cds [Oikopleura dioica]